MRADSLQTGRPDAIPTTPSEAKASPPAQVVRFGSCGALPVVASFRDRRRTSAGYHPALPMKLTRTRYGVLRGRSLLDPDGCPVPLRFAFDDFESQGLGMSLRKARKVARESRGRLCRIDLSMELLPVPPGQRRRST